MATGRIKPTPDTRRKGATQAILYLRFSPRRDAELSESNAVQCGYCQTYCEQHGYEVAEIFSDEALSGDDENRPGLWAAVKATRRNYVLVVHKADRLARSVYLDEFIRLQIKRQGGRIEVVDGCPNGDSPEDEMQRQLLAVVAQYFKRMNAVRTKMAMLHHQKQGRAMGSNPPYGSQRGPDKHVTDRTGQIIARRTWIEDPHEQAVMALILSERGKGKSFSAIARMLNEAEIASRGERWDKTSILRICRREGVA